MAGYKKFSNEWMDHDRPVFDSSFGFLMHINDISKYASGYIMGREIGHYYETLDALFIEIYPIIHKRHKGIPDDLKNARKLSKAAIRNIENNTFIDSDVENLKKYHILLNSYMHDAKLRLRTVDDMPGVLKQ